ncbi:MAG: penicillin acylase family protein, partial [Chitinophagales bacterium]|nr:penicillin acylase family protein [Chitinophagales bacterium]
MKHIITFILSFIATLGLAALFNNRIGQLPPLGKILNPFYGIWQNVERNNDFADEHLLIKGLKDSVTVLYDDRLVPHIQAKNDEDLYFIQGYITAKHRLWQMEISTHAAAGRLSEIVGEKALDNDRLMRRIGMVYGAENAEKFIAQDEHSKKMILAFCNGINAYINTLKPKDYPIEYKLLDYRPEEWTSIKVALLLKNMANMLSVFEYDIHNTAFVNRYGIESFRKLYPDFIADEDPIISDSEIEQKMASVRYPNLIFEDKAGMGNEKRSLPLNTDFFPKENSLAREKAFVPSSEVISEALLGSNNWAVHGNKTAGGKPILCNDPHLKLSLPSIWYEMHLTAPGVNVYGVSLPGAPGIIIGFNDSIAWGVTNAGRDVRDWYKIYFKDNSRSYYMLDSSWQPTTFRIETFKVRGESDFFDTIVFTHFGPVVYDRNYTDSTIRENLALKWTAHLPSNEFLTFHLLNRAKNYEDYRKAIQYFTCPAQN